MTVTIQYARNVGRVKESRKERGFRIGMRGVELCHQVLPNEVIWLHWRQSFGRGEEPGEADLWERAVQGAGMLGAKAFIDALIERQTPGMEELLKEESKSQECWESQSTSGTPALSLNGVGAQWGQSRGLGVSVALSPAGFFCCWIEKGVGLGIVGHGESS